MAGSYFKNRSFFGPRLETTTAGGGGRDRWQWDRNNTCVSVLVLNFVLLLIIKNCDEWLLPCFYQSASNLTPPPTQTVTSWSKSPRGGRRGDKKWAERVRERVCVCGRVGDGAFLPDHRRGVGAETDWLLPPLGAKALHPIGRALKFAPGVRRFRKGEPFCRATSRCSDCFIFNHPVGSGCRLKLGCYPPPPKTVGLGQDTLFRATGQIRGGGVIRAKMAFSGREGDMGPGSGMDRGPDYPSDAGLGGPCAPSPPPKPTNQPIESSGRLWRMWEGKDGEPGKLLAVSLTLGCLPPPSLKVKEP